MRSVASWTTFISARSVVVSAVISITCALDASAADLSAPMPVKAPVAAPVAWSWTGFYVGGNVGGAWGTSTYSFLPGPAWADPPPNAQPQLEADGAASLKMSNATAGVQAGYNWQIDRFVLGIEGDIQYIGLRRTNTFTQNGPLATVATPYTFTQSSSSNWLATVRGRAGFAVDRVLFYGTAGVAFANSTSSDTLTFPTFLPAATFTGTGARSGTATGWTVGGGLEWSFHDNWSVKAEYLHARFPTVTTAMTAINTTFTQSYTDQLALNVARVGLNYRFP